MAITAQQVMALRNATGAGMMDCKKALQESDGDMDKASEYLRKKGISIAQKKAGRETHEGAVGIAFSNNGKSGAIVHLGCETDFVARNEQFQELLGQVARQVLEAGDGNVLEQSLVEGEGTVNDLLTQYVATLGENMQIVDARRLAVDGPGVVGGYVHNNQRVGALVALSTEGEADGEPLQDLARDVAMHISAMEVSAVRPEDIDQELLDRERAILVDQAKESGKPDNVVEKMVEGRLNKFIKEQALLYQSYVKNPEQTVAELLDERGKALGTTVTVAGFAKLQF